MAWAVAGESSRQSADGGSDRLFKLLRELARAEDEYRADGTPVDVKSCLVESIREACHTVYDTAAEQPELAGMGSTVTAMVAYGSTVWIGHVGDSRAYLIEIKRFPITEDHSLVQEQVAAGLITPEQAKHSMIRNIILEVLGSKEMYGSCRDVSIERGDHVLLCSDGLTGRVEDDEILDIVLRNPRRCALETDRTRQRSGWGGQQYRNSGNRRLKAWTATRKASPW